MPQERKALAPSEGLTFFGEPFTLQILSFWCDPWLNHRSLQLTGAGSLDAKPARSANTSYLLSLFLEALTLCLPIRSCRRGWKCQDRERSSADTAQGRRLSGGRAMTQTVWNVSVQHKYNRLRLSWDSVSWEVVRPGHCSWSQKVEPWLFPFPSCVRNHVKLNLFKALVLYW